MSDISQQDSWQKLKCFTAARIALGRCGVSLPTREVLRFGIAHAQARDAVHLPFDAEALAARLTAHGFTTLMAQSQACDRPTYLRRPDLGRKLAPAARQALCAAETSCDLVFMVGDGLSSRAVHEQAEPFLIEARSRLEKEGISVGPVVLARQARVALGDEVAECLQAKLVVVLIGERPGLSSPDSLGLYLTWQAHVGCSDADRNCISNIRGAGLSHALAAQKMTWLVLQARHLGLSGVNLKDESDLIEAQ
ncbi:ethanolamine ammonia-lyase subunit EutC [Paludibacterium yongneupense]|uniref:ethanolamine ammonia-lyase subunit EutC n=1 Tax=Paludibacterium yongneupense TaxID=400061 RepID=UPI0004109BC9|nr:ethanolamine ammonia-lyase subunit EutC [Paludibacterium yongneupense]